MRASIHGERQQDVSSACLRSGGFPAPAQGGKPANATQEKKHGSRQRNRGRGLRLIGHQLRDRGTARGHAEEQVKAVLGSSEAGFADHAAKRPATPAVTKAMIKACMNSIERAVLGHAGPRLRANAVREPIAVGEGTVGAARRDLEHPLFGCKVEDDPLVLLHLDRIDGRSRSGTRKGGEGEKGSGKKRFHGKLELGKGLPKEANRVTADRGSRFG